MFVSPRTGAAVIAVALSACAHQASQVTVTPSYPGGRAAQPGGFIASSQPASFEQTPVATRDGASYLGGQTSQPFAWLPEQSPVTKHGVAESSCEPRGRAAQPFAGPSLYAVKAQTSEGVTVVCRGDGDPSGF